MKQNKPLPPRLAQVMLSLSYGKTRKQIAFETGLSINTVKTYINRIYGRAGAVNAADLVRKMYENGWLK